MRFSVVWALAFGTALILAKSTFAQETNDWRGVPRGAFLGPATPSAGAGDPPRSSASALVSTAAPRLEALGDNAIRFSSSPLMAKRAFIIEVHRLGAGPVSGTVTTLAIGKKRWERAGVRHFSLGSSEYQKLEAAIDYLMAERLPIFTGTDEVIVCRDSASFLTERLHGGKKSWVFGDYGPNYRIAKTLIAAAGGSPFDPAPRGFCGDSG